MVTTTFCVSGMVLAKAGENVDATLATVSNTTKVGDDYFIDIWITEAESYINVLTRNNYTDSYATLNVDTKKILQEASSNLAAIYAIQWNMAGYTSRIEAEDMINILWARFKQCIKLLEDQKAVTFLNGS